jgi:hypothetical protein
MLSKKLRKKIYKGREYEEEEVRSGWLTLTISEDTWIWKKKDFVVFYVELALDEAMNRRQAV